MMSTQTLVQLLDDAVRQFGHRPLFGTRRNGAWSWTSYRELARKVDKCRAGMALFDVGRGDRVALISNNSVEWAAVAHACAGLGAALVPMYEAQNPKDWRYIIEDCGAKLLVCANSSIFERCAELEDIPSLTQRVAIGLPRSHEGSFEGMLARGSNTPLPAIQPEPTDLACLIYTSGTTGNPKGVMLSHANICSNVNAMRNGFPIVADDRSLSFLPWAHSFGQTCELHALMTIGASMALCDDTSKIVGYLQDVQPTIMISVPRIFNRIYAGLGKKMSRRPKVIRQLFERGMALATKKRNGSLSWSERVTFETADRLVFSRVREQFGGKLKYAFSGGAALSKEVALFIDNLGITVYEGYGLSETSPVVSANRPNAHRIGSVGKPIEQVRVRIADAEAAEDRQGEIVVYGPNVMQGYLNLPEASKITFTEDGGFRTGDLGYLDEDGFLFITGRVKEQYKLENGKYVVPAPLEEQLKLSPYVVNIMVYGANRPHNVALVVVDIDALAKWADKRGLSFNDTAAMLNNERVHTHIMAELGERSANFKGYERIRKAILIDTDFTTDNGFLTPTMKVKRRAVTAAYQDKLFALYGQDAAAS